MASWLPCPRRATEVFGAARETATGKMPIQDGALPAKHGALGPNLAPCPRLSSFRAVKTGQKPTKTGQNLPQTGAKARRRGAAPHRRRERQKNGGQKNGPLE